MVPAPLIPLFLIVGLGLGVSLGTIVGSNVAHANQFKQDCVSMAHGTVLKDSPRVCRKGNTILFTAK